MPRLPKPGGDSGNWGDILNEYLSVSLSSDGTLKEGLLSKDSVGLSNVDNTSDTDKPVSAATQSALDGKLSATGGTVTGPIVFSNADGAQRAVDITYNTSYTGVNPRGLFVAPVFTGPASGAAAAAFAPTIQNDQNITSAYGFINNLLADPQPGANVTNAMAGYQWLRTGSAGGTISNAHGLRIAVPQIGATVPTNLYGLSVDAQNGGTNSYGVAIAEAGTASLHLSGTSGNTAAGIRFGDDTTLYRSGVAALTVNGKIATDGTAATHSLTVGASGNGLSIYNTGDQTTNYERGRLYWNSNVLTLSAESAGSGVTRNLALAAHGKYFNITGNGIAMGQGAIVAANFTLVSMQTNYQASSGAQTLLSVSPTISQSGTAGYTALLVNANELSLGTGSRNLIDAQVNGSTRFKVDSSGSVLLNGSLLFNASLRQGYAIRSANVTLTIGNATINFCDASSGPLTITLDTAVENGTTFTIKKTDASANNVTVVPSAGTIDGNANYVLSGQYKYVTVVAYNSGWQVIGNN